MIALGCDHAAVDFKNSLIEFLQSKGYSCEDVGTYTTESCNYVDYAKKVCEAVTSGRCEKGILVCGTGVGMAIAANKQKGIRCVNASEALSARLSRMHNDTNVLSMGARMIGLEAGKEITMTWLTTDFEGGRHIERVESLEK